MSAVQCESELHPLRLRVGVNILLTQNRWTLHENHGLC